MSKYDIYKILLHLLTDEEDDKLSINQKEDYKYKLQDLICALEGEEEI